MTGLGSTALKVNTGAVTCDEVERLGGEAEGYKEIRLPTADLTDFKMSFELRSEEHQVGCCGCGRPCEAVWASLTQCSSPARVQLRPCG